MANISNNIIPDNKNVPVSLTYIYGIGKSRAQKIVAKLNISVNKKTSDLQVSEIKALNEEIKQFLVGDELKQAKREIIEKEIKVGTYRGLRRIRKLPVNGQRTRHNARTSKGHVRKTVANKKKAPKPN
jgi:small subunit ribosomal protein S13